MKRGLGPASFMLPAYISRLEKDARSVKRFAPSNGIPKGEVERLLPFRSVASVLFLKSVLIV